MTTLTPPPERDVPPAVRSRVLEETDAAPRRPWIPVAAAAAVAVAVAVPMTFFAHRAGPDTPPAGSSTAAPDLAPWTPPTGPFPGELPTGAVIVRRCLDLAPDVGRPDIGDVAVRAVFTDRTGYVAWVGGSAFSATCIFSWSGDVGDDRLISLLVRTRAAAPTWAPDTGPRLAVTGVGGGTNRMVIGTVAPGVTQVRVRWGSVVAEAAARGPYFVARVIVPESEFDAARTVTAYRADGTAYEPVDLPAYRGGDLRDRLLLPDARLQPVDLSAGQRALELRACRLPALATVRVGTGFFSVVASGPRLAACRWRPDGTREPGFTPGEAQGTAGPLEDPITDFGLVGVSTNLGVWNGKVTAAVRRVTLTFGDGRTVEATVTGGTWLALASVYSVDFRPGGTGPDPANTASAILETTNPVVRAYGDGGKLLYDSTRGDVVCPGGHGRCSYPWP